MATRNVTTPARSPDAGRRGGRPSERLLDTGTEQASGLEKSVIRRLGWITISAFPLCPAPGAAMRRVITLLLASCCSSPLLASDVVQVSRCVPGSLLHEHRLEKTHVVDDFHIYSLQGKMPLRYPQDSTGDGVPDVIKILVVSYRQRKYLYTSLLGLRSPLRQKIMPRPDRLTSICWRYPKGHGLAFDRVAAKR